MEAMRTVVLQWSPLSHFLSFMKTQEKLLTLQSWKGSGESDNKNLEKM
jgi:hypothetical protein